MTDEFMASDAPAGPSPNDRAAQVDPVSGAPMADALVARCDSACLFPPGPPRPGIAACNTGSGNLPAARTGGTASRSGAPRGAAETACTRPRAPRTQRIWQIWRSIGGPVCGMVCGAIRRPAQSRVDGPGTPASGPLVAHRRSSEPPLLPLSSTTAPRQTFLGSLARPQHLPRRHPVHFLLLLLSLQSWRCAPMYVGSATRRLTILFRDESTCLLAQVPTHARMDVSASPFASQPDHRGRKRGRGGTDDTGRDEMRPRVTFLFDVTGNRRIHLAGQDVACRSPGAVHPLAFASDSRRNAPRRRWWRPETSRSPEAADRRGGRSRSGSPHQLQRSARA